MNIENPVDEDAKLKIKKESTTLELLHQLVVRDTLMYDQIVETNKKLDANTEMLTRMESALARVEDRISELAKEHLTSWLEDIIEYANGIITQEQSLRSLAQQQAFNDDEENIFKVETESDIKARIKIYEDAIRETLHEMPPEKIEKLLEEAVGKNNQGGMQIAEALKEIDAMLEKHEISLHNTITESLTTTTNNTITSLQTLQDKIIEGVDLIRREANAHATTVKEIGRDVNTVKHTVSQIPKRPL